MLSDNLAKPLMKVATRSFSKMYNPNKTTIQRIFVENWDTFLSDPEVIRRGLRPIVTKEVEKMMACGTVDSGFELYECPNCHQSHIICYTCKSRFCNSCGIKYATNRAEIISSHTLPVRHRHMVFTIDERLRVFFLRDRTLLNILFDAAKDTLFYAFHKMNGKQHTFKPGFILTLHTFGRALNFNPHIHCLVTEGGMNEEHQYKSINYINYETLRKSFMKQLLDHLKRYYTENPSYLKKIKTLINELYQDKKKGFYVNAPRMKSKVGKDAVVSYIIRYAGRPVMASSRITHYDHKKNSIQYYYEDHETKERIDVEESIFAFMKKLILHIPEAQFKMIRYYGLYATCHHHHKKEVKRKLEVNTIIQRSKQSYRQSLISVFDTDPLLCDCGHYMEFIEYWVPSNKRKREIIYDTT